MLKRVEVSCKEAADKAIRFREKQLRRVESIEKMEIIKNELKYLIYAKNNILHG